MAPGLAGILNYGICPPISSGLALSRLTIKRLLPLVATGTPLQLYNLTYYNLHCNNRYAYLPYLWGALHFFTPTHI